MMEMKYDPGDMLREIMHRRAILLERRQRRKTRALACTALVLTGLLTVAIGTGARAVCVGSNQSVYGSFLLADAAGGFVLTAVLAFILGVAVTQLCVRYRRRKTMENQRNADEHTEEKL